MCPQSNVNVVKDNKFCLLTKCGIVDTFQQSWKCFHHLFSNQRFFILKELYYHRPQTKMYSIWKKEQSLKNESYFSVWFYGLCLFDLELSQLTPKGAFFLTVQHSMQIIKWYFICHQCYYGYIVHCLSLIKGHVNNAWFHSLNFSGKCRKRWIWNCCASKMIWWGFDVNHCVELITFSVELVVISSLQVRSGGGNSARQSRPSS